MRLKNWTRHWIIPDLTLVVSLCLTLYGWKFIHEQTLLNEQSRFENKAVEVEHGLRDRLSAYQEKLRGAQGLFAASQNVERDEFQIWVEKQQLQVTFPGALGIGYLLRLPGPLKAAHIARLRADAFPQYNVVPEGEREEYFPVIYLEPMIGGNYRALGRDLFADPVRREAMERARDTADFTLSAGTGLIQDEQSTQTSCLMFLAVYKTPITPVSVGDRNAQLTGFVYCPFRVADVVRSIFGAKLPDISFEIHDETNPQTTQSLLYRDDPNHTSYEKTALFHTDKSLTAGGRTWKLRLVSLPAFEQAINRTPEIMSIIGGVLINLLLFGTVFSLTSRRAHAVAMAATMTSDLRIANERLERSVSELHQRTKNVLTLNEMGELLLSCQSEQEAYDVIGHSCEMILPRWAGSMYMLTDGNVQIQKVVASWGGDKGKNLPGFSPVDCWALRRGRIYVTKTGELQCNHAPEPGMHMCVPMTAQGKTLGLIHLYNPTEAGSEAERALDKQLALTVTEQGVLALANVRLRGILEQQSVRDPLTGLFNRRQLEIQLAIDLENARTQQRPLSILFADIDHFKKFNDRFGHSAGDVMLKTVGHYLEKRTAKKGIVARFGGEEFVIVLQADAQKAEEFATDLIQGVKTMDVQYGGQSLGCITLSVGIASYPSHADRHELLMKLADQALYQAKEDGRDRVVVAPA